MLKLISYVLTFIIGFGVCAGIYYAGNPEFRGSGEQPSSAAVAAVSPTASSAPTVTSSVTGSTIYAVAAVEPSVVNIDITGQPQPADNLGGFFGMQAPGGDQVVPQGVASGVIISSDGYILTNDHVAGDASSMTVTLHDGRRLPARVVGLDPRSDLAVVKVNANNLPVPHLGNSANVKVGQWVIAVGDPLGIGTTATHGIISAVRSPFPIRHKVFPEILQTDAAINPGNSGGALADLDGNIIGINTAIASTSGGSIGIGFSIPINLAIQHARQLIKNHSVVYPWLGIGYAGQVNQQLPVQGVLVSQVAPGGPADKAGIKPNDIITKVNDRAIDEPEKINYYIMQHQPGDQIKVTVWRNGHEQTVNVTLAKMPENLLNPQQQPQP